MGGDFVLEQVGEYLRHTKEAKVYKMPGGEFVLLFHRHFSYYELQHYLQEFYEKIIHLYVDYNNAHISLEFTIAAATAHSIDNILAKLSAALMYAQENNLTYYIYEDQLEFNNNFKENLILLTKVRDAIKKERIVAYYQPIIDNATGKISKYETLARLINEDGEILAPDQFLALSKKTKLYNNITKTMLRSALKMFANSEFEVSINISKDDIINNDTYEFIINELKNSKNSHKIVFEFLESDAIIEEKRILEFVTEIKRYGAKIAIDDFGSGYSNFSMLINMKVNYIKIDGSLIANIDTSWSSFMVVESIVEFAKKLGVEVIAEYVHSSTILSKVKALGIEYSQGFYIDKPRIDISETVI
jgi:EAL domain-containing protein (putative c-di-GMP-specific phosphodiesterase class I)